MADAAGRISPGRYRDSSGNWYTVLRVLANRGEVVLDRPRPGYISKRMRVKQFREVFKGG
jgi:hypothetical protein